MSGSRMIPFILHKTQKSKQAEVECGEGYHINVFYYNILA